jgi:predicted ABC-type transport system involved in lysophospholipase L1 biosynthesis ATPase subunit
MDLIDEVAREHGAAVLVATHDSAVGASCRRHLRMLDGRLYEDAG